MKTLEDNLTAIVTRLGVAIITTRASRMRDAIPGWCISDGGASEVCAATIPEAAAWFVVLLDANPAEPFVYRQRSE